MFKHLPNMLTILRMLLVPVILLIMYSFDVTESWILLWGAGSLFVIAIITDALDGYLSRKYNLVSDFGKFMDPIADKFLILSVLIGFLTTDSSSPNNILIFVLIMMIREFLVTVMRMFAANCRNNQLLTSISLFTLTTAATISLGFLNTDKNLFLMKISGSIIVLMLAISFILSSYFLSKAKGGVVLAANMWGKAKTVSQTIAIIIHFIFNTIKFPLVGHIALLIAAFITLISGIVYIKEYAKYIKRKN